MNIFLIGFMGSGKNYWAEKLSVALNLQWKDLDREIEKMESTSIRGIFETKGEEYFRKVEAATLRSVTPHREGGMTAESVIIATGGGAPCFHENMQWMNEHGLTVWLNPSAEELEVRLKAEREHRPLLQHLTEAGLQEFIISKIDERQEFYNKAKLEIKNTNIAVPAFINLILHAQKPH